METKTVRLHCWTSRPCYVKQPDDELHGKMDGGIGYTYRTRSEYWGTAIGFTDAGNTKTMDVKRPDHNPLDGERVGTKYDEATGKTN